MIRRKGIALAIAAIGVLNCPFSLDAGLFSRSTTSESCETCSTKPERKNCLSCLIPPPAPRAKTAVAVPAVITNQRGERPVKKDEIPPTPPAAGVTEERVANVERDVQIIKEQLRVLTTLLQETHK